MSSEPSRPDHDGARFDLLAPLRPLARWVRAKWRSRGLGAIRFKALPMLAPESREPEPPLAFPEPDLSLHPGVNLYGYVHAQFGLGQTARLYARALLAARYPVAVNDAGISIAHSSLDQSLGRYVGNAAPYPINLVFVNPDLFGQLAPRLSSGTYTIAFWFWELDAIPAAWMASIDLVDEIWVSTRFIESAFKRATDKPVFRMPHPIVVREGARLPRAAFDLKEDAFVFLCSFDFHSSIHRKNPWAVIDAFRTAFPDKRAKVNLLVKSSNGFRYPDQMRALLKRAARDSRILIRDQVLDDARLNALFDTADAYVSLHRAEGLGLGLAESMARGKPVIGTAWSGNLDFMNETNSCLVPCKMIDVEPGQYFFVEKQQWADPDVNAAAQWMARLASDPALARRLGSTAKRDISKTMNFSAAAAAMRTRLQALQLFGNESAG